MARSRAPALGAMSRHQSDQQVIERRVRVDQERSCLTSVEMPAPSDDRELIDEWLTKAKETFDGVTEGGMKACCFGAVFTCMELRFCEQRGGQVGFCVEVRQQIADEVHAALTEPDAVGLRQVG